MASGSENPIFVVSELDESGNFPVYDFAAFTTIDQAEATSTLLDAEGRWGELTINAIPLYEKSEDWLNDRETQVATEGEQLLARLTVRAPRGAGKAKGLIVTIPSDLLQQLVVCENVLYSTRELTINRSSVVTEALVRVTTNPETYLSRSPTPSFVEKATLSTRVPYDDYQTARRIAYTAKTRTAVSTLVALALVDVIAELEVLVADCS